MSGPGDLLTELADHMDSRLMAGWIHTVSVPTPRVRSWLRSSKRPFIDPGGPQVSLADADATAAWVVEQARWSGGTLGGIAGLGGAASVPPEIVATVIHALRLAQRLCVVYGFDHSTDRGRMVLWQTLAAGFEVELPNQGPIGLRLSELPSVLVRRSDVLTVGGALARRVLRRSALMVVGRLFRLLPVVSAGLSASDGQRRMAEIGSRMSATLRRVAEQPGTLAAEDAQELT
ncbi:MAG: hypothetical protein ACI8PZ_004841 [Myxococcota bacterium]|jgi:hypothetical protein